MIAKINISASAQGEIQGNGKTIKTPQGNPWQLPTAALADLVAKEWQAQQEKKDPDAMGMTRMAFTAIDRIPQARDEVIEEMLRYAGTDLLCYRSPDDAALHTRQEAEWGKWLSWATGCYGVNWKVTQGIMPVQQPEETIQALRTHLQEKDDWTLTGLSMLTSISGSLVLALAVENGALDILDAGVISQLEDRFQMEKWGKEEQKLQRLERAMADLREVALFLQLLKLPEMQAAHS